MWVNLIFLFYKPKASAREAGSHTVEQEPAKQQKGEIKPELQYTTNSHPRSDASGVAVTIYFLRMT